MRPRRGKEVGEGGGRKGGPLSRSAAREKSRIRIKERRRCNFLSRSGEKERRRRGNGEYLYHHVLKKKGGGGKADIGDRQSKGEKRRRELTYHNPVRRPITKKKERKKEEGILQSNYLREGEKKARSSPEVEKKKSNAVMR